MPPAQPFLALALLAAAVAAHGQTAQQVTVTGARAPKQLTDVASSISVVQQEELRDQLAVASNILSALDVLVPGLTASQQEFRSGCRTNIRGRPAQFLINGVPTNDNLRRSNCGSLFGINPFAVERLEVVRGATSLFGAGAPGGVINLLTRRAQGNSLETDVAAQWSFNPGRREGSNEYTAYVGAGRRFDEGDFYVGGSFQRYGVRRNPDDGVVPGTEFEAQSFNASLGWRVGTGELRLTALYNREDPLRTWATDFTQVSGERFADRVFVIEPRNPYEHESVTKQHVLALSYDVPDVWGHHLTFSLFNHDERLTQRAADYFEGEVFYFDSDAENQRLGLRTTAVKEWASGAGDLQLTYGLDWLRQRYYRPQVDPAAGRAVIGYISPEVILSSTAVFVQPQLRRGPWLLSAGVRHEAFRGRVGDQGFNASLPRAATPGRTPDFSLTLFNLGAVLDLTPQLQLFGGFSQGAEISEFGRAARGARDPSLINLEAAKSDQVELGLRGRQGSVDFSAAVFHSRSDKAADLQSDPSCAGQPLCPLIPLRRAQKLHGVELTADWRLTPAWGVGGLMTYQKGEYTEPGAAPVPFGTDTVSPPRATLYLDYGRRGGWQTRLKVTGYAKTDEYDEAQQAQGLRNTASVVLLDVHTAVPVGPGRLSLGVSNLLDRRYVNVTNQAGGDFFYYLSEGRRASLTYQATF